MKNLNYCLTSLLVFILLACGSSGTKKNELPVVDVTKSYPAKEIVLQDIADVEYVPLETRDDVLLEGNVRVCIASPDSIFVGNYNQGDLFLFNGNGKLVQKFNRKGQSGMEYQSIWGIFFDKKSQEIIVSDYPMKHQFQVYDTEGIYKRTLSFDEQLSFLSNDIVNYSDSTLLCYKGGLVVGVESKKNSTAAQEKPFIFLSKKDGKTIGDLPISLTNRVNANIVVKKEKEMFVMSSNIRSVMQNEEDVILSEISKDTLFICAKDKELKPIAVRTPKIATMKEPLSFLSIEKITNGYIFGTVVGKETVKKYKFTTTHIVIDRATNEIFESKLVVADAPEGGLGFENIFSKNTPYLLLQADELKDKLEEGQLNGKLKEIAENIKIDSNPVLVLVKFKE